MKSTVLSPWTLVPIGSWRPIGFQTNGNLEGHLIFFQYDIQLRDFMQFTISESIYFSSQTSSCVDGHMCRCTHVYMHICVDVCSIVSLATIICCLTIIWQQLSVVRHLDCFCILTIVNTVLLNKGVQRAFSYCVFVFLGYNTRTSSEMTSNY